MAKLVSGLITPAMLAIFGIYIHRVTKRFEHLQWRAQKLIEKRLSVYDDLAPSFNDLLCYFTYVGSWKDLDPPSIVSLKRVMDKKIHLAAPLFSPEFFVACSKFQGLCFQTYSGWGRDPLLRTNYERRRDACRGGWKVEWSDCFSSIQSDPKEISAAYLELMTVFASDIGVHQSFKVPQSGHIPSNIR
ncbi:hypothetical protein ACI2UN_24560 [Ralstonia nicotianae]|nr:hypothetical protein G7968_22965 [Ralstonia solanacearum]